MTLTSTDRIIAVAPFDMVVFGATGDLASKKIFPSLFNRFCVGQMPKDARIFAIARQKLNSQTFREMITALLAANYKAELHGKKTEFSQSVQAFVSLISYFRVDLNLASTEAVQALFKSLRRNVVRVFYLSVAPSLFSVIAEKINAYSLFNDQSRIVIEKPFGNDQASGRQLNQSLLDHFDEKQIYRIDHYLGKETVQNLMALRFSNILFEPMWNRQFIDYVEITVAEKDGVKGRVSYYDTAGAIKDMLQNHLMQLICLVATEIPTNYNPVALREEKLKVIRSLSPLTANDFALGQYQSSAGAASYLDDVRQKQSHTETFVAMRMHIQNWRWAGVPFFVRTGKRLARRLSEIVVHFRTPPHWIFNTPKPKIANALVIRLQPDEGLEMNLTIKEPGLGGMRFIDVPLDMRFSQVIQANQVLTEAYERLIMDVVRGDQTLFMGGEEIEAAWGWIDQALNTIKQNTLTPEPYDAFSQGPQSSQQMLANYSYAWRELKPDD